MTLLTVEIPSIATVLLWGARADLLRNNQNLFRSGPGKPNQKKASSWTSRRGIPEQKFNVNRACFPKEKTPEFTKMGEIHELFVLPLSLVWFAGATPDLWSRLAQHSICPKTDHRTRDLCAGPTHRQWASKPRRTTGALVCSALFWLLSWSWKLSWTTPTSNSDFSNACFIVKAGLCATSAHTHITNHLASRSIWAEIQWGRGMLHTHTHTRLLWGGKKTNKHTTHKRFSDGPCWTIVPGTSPHPSRDKRDKMAFYCWVTQKKGWFVPRTGPVCPRDGSAPKCLCLLFFLPQLKHSHRWAAAARWERTQAIAGRAHV